MRLDYTVVVAIAAAVAALGCDRTPVREYELRGQVIAVDAARREITIKHEDIPRFMPGMTMPFKVRDARLLEGRVPGDLVRATLVVEDADAHLRTLERTGSAPIAREPAPPAASVLLGAGEEVPDAAFIDQTGASRRLSEWRGQVLAVTFIYTRCPVPTFCPAMDRNFKAAQSALEKDPSLRTRAHLVSVSFDPDVDRPPVLAAHARRVGADPGRWTFLTGDRDEIDRFASRFGVAIMRDDPREIVHNLRTPVIDAEGRLVEVLRGNEWTVSDLLATMRKAMDARR